MPTATTADSAGSWLVENLGGAHARGQRHRRLGPSIVAFGIVFGPIGVLSAMPLTVVLVVSIRKLWLPEAGWRIEFRK